jgi:hypothetical protein
MSSLLARAEILLDTDSNLHRQIIGAIFQAAFDLRDAGNADNNAQDWARWVLAFDNPQDAGAVRSRLQQEASRMLPLVYGNLIANFPNGNWSDADVQNTVNGFRAFFSARFAVA